MTLEPIPPKAHVHLAGIPGTGKSAFARWLNTQYGFFHFDVDREGSFNLDEILGLMHLHNRLVLDWGFGVWDLLEPSLAVISQLQRRGMVSWWFDGDRNAALMGFLAAGKPGQEWIAQVQGIDAGRKRIVEAFAGRQLRVIDAGPVYMSHDKKVAIIFGLETLKTPVERVSRTARRGSE